MKDRIRSVPALSDLSVDIGNGIPPELIREWAEGEQSERRAHELLHPFRLRGSAVASDTTGLSQMTQENDLLHVLSLISRPKELIHGLGTALGGQPIGRWVADNTMMFYDESIKVDEVVGAMLELHRRLPPDLPRIGLCVHSGVFYHIGGGLYGPDADLVEFLAEERSRGGETLLTEAARQALRRPERFELARREDLDKFGPVYQVVRGEPPTHLAPTNFAYPAPYDSSFSQLLSQLSPEKRPRTVGETEPYQHEKAILLMEYCPGERQEGLAGLLDELVNNTLLDVLFRRMLSIGEYHVKTGGRLALAAFDTIEEALDVARRVRAAMAERGLLVRAGIDAGPVLLFPMEGGSWEYAGDPVNIASKQAEDCGEPGWIYLSERVAAPLALPVAVPCEWQVSGIRIRALGLPPENWQG